jgi:4-hydroxy-tetrahydrodipicolinate synthase
MKKMTLSGSMTALATPFRKGTLDVEAFSWLVDYQATNGTSAVVPMGTTGESVAMRSDERRQAIEVTVKANQGRMLVIAGAGAPSTSETIDNVTMARDAGADAALVVTPAYNKPTQAGLVEHYRLIVKAHPGFPLVLYNVPGRTQCDLLPDTAKRLCDFEEVVAIKEATGSVLRCLDVFEQCGERLTLLSGDDFIVAPFCLSGGRGVISVSANVVPKFMADLVAHALARRVDQALALQLALQPLHRLLFAEPNPAPVKRALQLMGRFAEDIRPPMLPCTPALTEKLEDALKRLGIVT